MSTKYPGGFITKSPVAPTSSAASGIWTLDQQEQLQKAGTWPAPPNYIEEVFSTYLYTGNATSRTITNSIDLSSKGGLTWIKNRTNAGYPHMLYDTIRGATKSLSTNDTVAQLTYADSLTAFNSNGFSLGADTVSGNVNNTGENYASWTFREQPKFFDVVTFTFASGSPFTFNHSLGSTPACIIFKRTDNASNWITYHRGLNGGVSPSNWNINLNSTAAQYNEGFAWLTSITSTSVTISTDYFADGGTYVAYLFAHDSGGFGLTGTDNVISCGVYTGTGTAGNAVTLGYEPQWLIIKRATGGTGNWHLVDIMRGMTGTDDRTLYPNSAIAENVPSVAKPTATGFEVTGTGQATNFSGSTYIYIAIRRGPMAVPTTGTSVFEVDTDGLSLVNGVAYTSGWPVDWAWLKELTNTDPNRVLSRLTGAGNYLATPNTNAEASGITYGTFDNNTGWFSTTNASASWMFRRAPSFFDEVCYTGNSVDGQTQAHNLGVIPELILVKNRTAADNWMVTGTFTTSGKFLDLSTTGAIANYGSGWRVDATATALTLGYASQVNGSGYTYVAYLFATCAGVSKVGSYTGTGALQTVNCGFTSGARFVLIKRTDSTGDWYYWDSARGITSGNDPYLLLNSTAAQVTGTNYVDTNTTGFQVTAAAPAGLNANGGTYIFLAIA